MAITLRSNYSVLDQSFISLTSPITKVLNRNSNCSFIDRWKGLLNECWLSVPSFISLSKEEVLERQNKCDIQTKTLLNYSNISRQIISAQRVVAVINVEIISDGQRQKSAKVSHVTGRRRTWGKRNGEVRTWISLPVWTRRAPGAAACWKSLL